VFGTLKASDAIAVQAERMGTETGDFLLEGAAKSPGADNAFWSTGVRAFNPGSAPLEVTIEAIGFPASPALMKRTVAARAVEEFPRVLGFLRPIFWRYVK